MKPAAHPTALRTQQLLAERGFAVPVVEFDQPTRTSETAFREQLLGAQGGRMGGWFHRFPPYGRQVQAMPRRST
ncbi:MAG TPA: hypothetical protein VF096_07595, partial [Azonexus sp.]